MQNLTQLVMPESLLTYNNQWDYCQLIAVLNNRVEKSDEKENEIDLDSKRFSNFTVSKS